MCKRMGLVCLLAVAAGSRLAGQNLERLRKMWVDAAAASARVDSLARVRLRIGLDSVRAGNLVVLTPRELRPLAAPIAPVVWTRLEGVYGEEARSADGGPLVVGMYQAVDGPPPYGFPLDAVTIPVAPGSSPGRVEAQLALRLPEKLRERLDPALNGWVSKAISLQRADSAPPDLYEDLVTSVSPLARGCYVGDLAACRSALGVAATRDAAMEWYDPGSRRVLVSNMVFVRDVRRERDPSWYDQCVAQGLDAACLRILHGPDSVHLAAPLGAGGRELLLRIALAAGGAHAFHRLLVSAGQPLTRRLEITSGVPLDSLLARWHSVVLATRPQPVVLSAGTGWAALLWASLLGALVLGSSKWRL